MAYTPHVLVAFGGSWSNALTEIWECTVRLSADGGGGDTLDPDGYISDIATGLATWYHGAGMALSSQLKWVKVNHIGADGLYADKTTTHVHDYSPPIAGITLGVAPGFCTLAYTWETAHARGPGHRGRIYPPNNAYATVSSFQVSAGDATANAEAGASLLAILKNSAGAPGRKGTPVIASKVDASITPITGCTSDTVYDVQRRRKNRIVGTRSAVATFA